MDVYPNIIHIFLVLFYIVSLAIEENVYVFSVVSFSH